MFVGRYALCQAWPPTNSLKPATRYVTEAGNVRGYRPDFLLERIDGAKELHKGKGGQFINNPNTIRKHKAARDWCRKRGIRFVVITK